MEKETAEKFIFEVKCFSKICGNHSLTAPSAETLVAMVGRPETSKKYQRKM
jgi:hypothetical protein